MTILILKNVISPQIQTQTIVCNELQSAIPRYKANKKCKSKVNFEVKEVNVIDWSRTSMTEVDRHSLWWGGGCYK